MKAVYNSRVVFFGNTRSQIVYDPLGRMTDKQADGQTVFANAAFAAAQGQPAQPHAMKSAAVSTLLLRSSDDSWRTVMACMSATM